MLVSGQQIIDTPVMGLQTGAELARVSEAVVNADKLSVIAYRIAGDHIDYDPSYLRVLDIREIGKLGMIIDDSEEFIEPDDIITEKDVYERAYELEGKPVCDERGHKLGKVTDYIVDIDSFVIEQLVVQRPLLQSLKDDELIIHRSQVVKTTDEKIVVKSGKIKQTSKVKRSRHYVNPFRNTSPQPETIRIDDR